METINPSRRKILAGVAAAPLVAFPNAAPALAMATPADPIFQALGAFRLAKSAHMEAEKAQQDIENVNFKLAFPFKFRAAIGEETTVVSFLTQLTEWLETFAPTRHEVGIREIGALAEKFLSRPSVRHDLFEPYASPAAVLRDELDAGGFKGSAHGGDIVRNA